VRARLGRYLDFDLDARERGQVARHLEVCAECSRELRELERTVALLQDLPRPEAPPALADSVIARVRAGEAEPRGLAWLWTRLGAPDVTLPLAAGLAGLALLLGLHVEQAPTVAAEPVVASSAAPPEVEPASAVTPQFRHLPEESPRPLLEAMNRRRLALERHGPPRDVARILRGAGHPHSASLASEIEAHHPPNVAAAAFSPR
jgi:hypothetical protein